MKKDKSHTLAKIKSMSKGSKLVFVSGNFDILHPGHQRLLKFASECGDYLCVGINNDAYPGVQVPADLRMEGVNALSWVDFSVHINNGLEKLILDLQPALIVKGKEHESRFNLESELLNQYGGKLLFSSGDTQFSSLDLICNEFAITNFEAIKLPVKYLHRHSYSKGDLLDVLKKIKELKVAVLGDVILDEYITCDPLGMSQEDPTLVVSPISSEKFLGGAGIVAAHAQGLGAEVNFVSICGKDSTANKIEGLLKDYGVNSVLLTDESRPTTLKQRYRAHQKTLLRVNHLKQHDISKELQKRIFEEVETIIDGLQLLIFSDFNYGTLPQSLVDRICKLCIDNGVMMVADSQSSSQIGDVSRFQGMTLLTPTEREARLAVNDKNSGLVILAEKLREKSNCENVLLTLGREGLIIHAESNGEESWETDRISAMNSSPKDSSGAGDSLLTCCSLAMAASADIWLGAYLGSIAAACQVGRVGNVPLSVPELIREIEN